MIRRAAGNAGGFTLLDVMLSVGLVALVMMVTASVVVVHTRALGAAGGAADEQQVIRRVVDEIADMAARAEHRSERPRLTGASSANAAGAAAPAIAEVVDTESFRSVAFRVPPLGGATADSARGAVLVVRFCWDRATGRLWRVVALEGRGSASETWPARPTYVASAAVGACGATPAGFFSATPPQVAGLGRSVSGPDWTFSAFEVAVFDANGALVPTTLNTAGVDAAHLLWRGARVRVTLGIDSNRNGGHDADGDATVTRTVPLRQTL